MNRRQFGLTALITSAALPALAGAAPCSHRWVNCGSIGHRTEHQLLVCRDCRLERVDVSNIWVGDKTREGLWSLDDYQREVGNLPARERIDLAIAAHIPDNPSTPVTIAYGTAVLRPDYSTKLVATPDRRRAAPALERTTRRTSVIAKAGFGRLA